MRPCRQMDPFGGRHRTAASFSAMGPSEPMGQKAAGSTGTAGSRGSLFKVNTRYAEEDRMTAAKNRCQNRR